MPARCISVTQWIGQASKQAIERFGQAWPGVLISAATAGVAWMTAQALLRDAHPAFAAGAAVVCLSPGVASRGGQAVGMLTGILIGVLVGFGAVLLPVPTGAPLLIGATGIAMLLAAGFGLSAVMLIQAGVSAIIVLAVGPVTGWNRLGDAVIGSVLALLASQVLFTPDPVRLVSDAWQDVLKELAEGLDMAAVAARRRERDTAQRAVECFRTAAHRAGTLAANASAARGILRATVKGRLTSATARKRIERQERAGFELCAVCLSFGMSLKRALRHAPPPPVELCTAIHRAAELYRALAAPAPRAKEAWTRRPKQDGTGWEGCEALLDLVLHTCHEAIRAETAGQTENTGLRRR